MQRQLLNTLFNELPAFIYWVDCNQECLGYNNRFARLLELTPSAGIVGQALQSLQFKKSEAIIPEWIHNNSLALNQIAPSTLFRESFPPLNQKNLICHSYKLPIKKRNRIVGLLNVSFDITSQIEEKEQSQHQHDTMEIALNTILAHLPGHVYWQDKNGIILGCNERQARSLGFSSAQKVIGKHPNELIPKKESEEILAVLNKIVATGEPVTLEEKMTFMQGTIDLLSQKVPLQDNQGNIVGMLGLSMDISKQKELERNLIREKEKAIVLDQLKSDFIENMQHDIRTPLTGVYGMIDLLELKEQDPEKKALLKDLSFCTKELLDYCDDILNFSKIESASLPIAAKNFRLDPLLKSVIQLESLAAKNKKIDLLFESDPKIPNVIIGDPYRLKRILINLISNAIKFTHNGFVKLSVSLAESDALSRQLILKFAVEDTGIGISKETQELIYERFTKAIASNKGLYRGLGLGLYIVKQFVDELDGNIHLKSELRKGSCFTLFIPFKIPLSDSIVDDEDHATDPQ